MGAPCVITTPSKSYVAINSNKSARSVPPTLCDLGRVSNIAAVVTLPRSSHFVNNNTRNNIAQSIRSLSNKKRPISEVSNCSSSSLNSYHENTSTVSSNTNATASHKKRRCTSENQSSTSSLVTSSIMKSDLDISHNSNPKAKEINLPSIETSSIVYSPNGSSAAFQNIPSVSIPQNTQRDHIAQANLHAPNTNQLPNQQSVQLSNPGMEQLPSQHLHQMQLQEQNQQLHNANMQLKNQLSLFMQLMKNPQRLNQVIARLEQRVQ